MRTRKRLQIKHIVVKYTLSAVNAHKHKEAQKQGGCYSLIQYFFNNILEATVSLQIYTEQNAQR
jgi:hypothetical protein